MEISTIILFSYWIVYVIFMLYAILKRTRNLTHEHTAAMFTMILFQFITIILLELPDVFEHWIIFIGVYFIISPILLYNIAQDVKNKNIVLQRLRYMNKVYSYVSSEPVTTYVNNILYKLRNPKVILSEIKEWLKK